MSETVTFLIGAVEFVARLKLNRYDIGWTDPKISFAYEITLHCNTKVRLEHNLMDRLS